MIFNDFSGPSFWGPKWDPKKEGPFLVPEIIENVNIPWTTLNVTELFGSCWSHFVQKHEEFMYFLNTSEHLKIPDFFEAQKTS